MRSLAAVAAALMLAACADAPSREPTAPTAAETLERFRTYAHGPVPESVPDLPNYTAARGREIQERIDLRLQALGLSLAPAEEADLLVVFSLAGYRVTQGVGGFEVGSVFPDHTEGSLSIRVLDQKTKEVFWHGFGMKPLFGDREVPASEVNAVVDGIMQPFPN